MNACMMAFSRRRGRRRYSEQVAQPRPTQSLPSASRHRFA
jgi:hypothetical protein